MKLIIKVMILLLLIGGCSSEKEALAQSFTIMAPSIETSEKTLVTPLNTTVILYIYDEKKYDEAKQIFEEKLSYLHKLFDKNHYYIDERGEIITNLKVINDAYGTNTLLNIDPFLTKALEEAKDITKLSNGYFNLTLGKVNELWRGKFSPFGSKDIDPSPLELEEAKKCVVSSDRLDEIIVIQNDTLNFKMLETCSDKVVIDLGAYVKGFIGDEIKADLMVLDTPFMLNLGESSIVTYSNDSKLKNNWNIGIKSPFMSNKALYAIEVKGDGAISTSADDQRYFLLKDNLTIRRHHVLNGLTGYSENYYRGCSVVSSSNSGVMDALSTILFSIESENERKHLISSFEKHFDIEINYALIKEEEEKQYLIVDDGLKSQLVLEFVMEDLKIVEE